MASTFDSLLRLELQATGENANTWGDKTNNNIELVADAIAGSTSISIAGSGNYTLTTANAATDQARKAFITLTGTLTGNRTIIVPSSSKIYYVRNNTSGAFTVTFKTASGVGALVPQGYVLAIACDGTDCFDASEVARVAKAGDTMTGALLIPSGLASNAARALRSDEVDTKVAAAVPTGVITMWSGSIASIPSGWNLCDGTNGTPDLRDRFVVGAGSTYAVGATGGATTDSITTSSNGAHTHTGATGSTTLTESQIPAHTHTGTTNTTGSHTHTLPGQTVTSATGFQGGTAFGYAGSTTNAAGDHSHTFTTDSTGGGTGHTHTIDSDGAHTHTATVDTVPPYYALAYIMKL
jgi:microcystin-dependent protein